MSPKIPAVYASTHRVKFSDLDPYRHMRTAQYAAYFVDHRLAALREQAGWDLATLETLPFMTFVRRLDVEFLDAQGLGTFKRSKLSPFVHAPGNPSPASSTSAGHTFEGVR